jgi:glycosyltransferase involved in cell wall biosynthesis
MRIAYLLPAPGVPVQGPSGASAHTRDLAQALRLDHDLRLYATRREDRRGEFGPPVSSTVSGVASWPGVLKSWRELREVRTARRLADRALSDALDDWMPDVVVERHTLFSDAGWRLHDRLGVPWVLEVNAPPVLERRRFEEIVRPALAERWQRAVLQAAPAVVGVSRWLVRWLREEMGCRNVRWVPNGVNALRGDRARGRAALGLSADEPVVGFVGSLRPWHGVELLAPVAEGARARLVVVGHAPPDRVPKGAIHTGFLGPQALADVVAALDVGLAPYPADAPPWFCPLKVLDYRAQGTPIVAADVGDVGTLVEEGGSVVPAGDLNAMVTATCAWLGRRTEPRVRSWRSVGRELLAAAGV